MHGDASMTPPPLATCSLRMPPSRLCPYASSTQIADVWRQPKAVATAAMPAPPKSSVGSIRENQGWMALSLSRVDVAVCDTHGLVMSAEMPTDTDDHCGPTKPSHACARGDSRPSATSFIVGPPLAVA